MGTVIPLSEHSRTLDIIKVYRYKKNFSIENLSTVTIKSFFMTQLNFDNETGLNSFDDLILSQDLINSLPYLSLDDLINDLHQTINSLYYNSIQREYEYIKDKPFYEKIGTKHNQEVKKLKKLKDCYNSFLSQDFKNLLSIDDNVNTPFNFTPITLEKELFFVKHIGLDIFFENTKIKKIDLMYEENKYYLRYETIEGLVFEHNEYTAEINRIKTHDINTTLYIDDKIAIFDYNSIIDEFNQRNTKFII